MTDTSTPAVIEQRLEVREANEGDNEGLLALTRAAPMRGHVALRIDRDPDFFALLRLRGKYKVYVAVHKGGIVGSISLAYRPVYVCGSCEIAGYLGDMKVHPRFAFSRIGLRLLQTMESFARSAGIDLVFCVVAAGNQRVMPLFEGRLGLPRWSAFGRFVVHELLPSPIELPSRRYHVEQARAEDTPAIAALLDGFYRSRQFGPCISESETAELVCGARNEPFSQTLVARDGNHPVATLTVLDTLTFKRNVLLGAPLSSRASLGLLRLLTAPFPRFYVPRISEALRLLTAHHFACESGHLDALRALVQRARRETYRRRFSFLVLGPHERDPLRQVVRGIPGFTFSSLAFALSLNNVERLEPIKAGIPFEDYALV